MSLNRKRSMVDRVLSTFDDYPTTRPSKRSRSNDSPKPAPEKLHAPELDDIGIIRTLGKADSLSRALDTSEYIKASLFDDIPERRAGMTSTRMAEVLNFRLNVPPLITAAHLHALSQSPSAAEREIADRIRTKKLRRIHIPLRGQGTASVSDMLIATDDIQRLLKRSKLKEKTCTAYLSWLGSNPFATTITSDALAPDDVASLLQAGFLTTAASIGPSTSAVPATAAARGSAMSLETIASAVSGTAAAVGGTGGSFAHGGGGAGALQARPSPAAKTAAVYQITVPNTGAYLKLLVAARNHLVELLKKSSRRELPLYLLKEYWEAGLGTKKVTSSVSRDPFENLMPGQTKKWKSFYGMTFDWVLEEAFGGGLVECFNTKSVGLGVRLP